MEFISFDQMQTGRKFEGVGCRYNEPTDPVMSKELVWRSGRPLYITDTDLCWNSPHLQGEDAQVLYSVNYTVNNPLVFRGEDEPFEVLDLCTSAKMMGYDSIVYIPKKGSQHDDTRQAVLLYPEKQVIDISIIPRRPETFEYTPVSEEQRQLVLRTLDEIRNGKKS